MFDDWIPWPDIDGLTSSPKAEATTEVPHRTIFTSVGSQLRSSSTPPSKSLSNPLEGLSKESSTKCKQIHDMGFPLGRLAKACKSLGNDDQQMINYCLLVDKLVEEPVMACSKSSVSNYSSVVEDVVLLHSMDESRIQKHLEAFARLAEFGFEPPSKVHDALIKCDLDYEKALEQILK